MERLPKNFISEVISVILGCVLEIFNFGLRITNILWNYLVKLPLFFSDFTPTPDFLSDVAAFEAVVIALAIPLSFEIVSRISERYQSEVISRKFIQGWIIKWLPRFLVFNIILAVALRFFVKNNPTCTIWKILAWTTFAGFLIIAAIFLFGFIPRLKRYMTDSDFVLEELFNEAEKSIK